MDATLNQEPAARAASASAWGHVTATVTIRDENGETREETVQVRELTAEQLEGYLIAFLSEPRRIEYACEMPQGWANGLTRESHAKLVEIDEGLNMDFFSRWKERRDRLASLAMDPNLVTLQVEGIKLAFLEIFEPLKDVAKLEAAKMLSGGLSPMAAPPSDFPGAKP